MSPTELRYDAVVLDVGGTLLGFHDRAPFQAFLAEAGLEDGEEDAGRLRQRLGDVVLARRDGAQGLGASGEELSDWWRGNFADIWPDRPDLAHKMLDWLLAGRLDRLFDDSLPAVEELQELGLQLGVLSNFGVHLRDVLASFGLLSFFSFVLVSAEVGLAKPDPRIFDLVVEAAGAPRERLLYVGDHLGDDVEGARGAGLGAALIDREDRHPEALCPRIRSLRHLIQYVQVPKRPESALLFDMDGVLVDSMPMHLQTWQQALAPLGVRLTADDLYPLEGVPTERTAQLLTARLLGEPCSEEEARRLAERKRALFRRDAEPALLAGTGPLLHDLQGRGYRLGLVTGSARQVADDILGPTGMADLFEAMVTGDEVAHGKPSPEPYQTAAGRLRLPPERCLVVENAPLGIQAARAAGMRCLALETTLPAEQLTAAGAEGAFPTVAELRDWLLAQWLGADS
jgi:beta-phosphoglucomutase